MKHRLRWAAAGGAAVLLCGTAGAAATADRNKDVVRAMVEAINQRDLGALDRLLKADVRRHSGATPGLAVSSLAQFKAFLEEDFRAVPDSVQTVHAMLAEGDLVAVRATYAGTQTGPWGPFPPSGRRVELPFLAMLRLEDGKIAEIWVEWDNLHALMQLGHFPTEEAAGGGEP